MIGFDWSPLVEGGICLRITWMCISLFGHLIKKLGKLFGLMEKDAYVKIKLRTEILSAHRIILSKKIPRNASNLGFLEIAGPLWG